MKTPPRPRLNQVLGPVKQQGAGPVAVMGLELQQQLSLMGRNPETTVSDVFVGPSPFTYQNTSDYDVDAIVVDGVVNFVAFSRDGTNFYNVATATNTTVLLNPGDYVKVTWSGQPQLILVPR